MAKKVDRLSSFYPFKFGQFCSHILKSFVQDLDTYFGHTCQLVCAVRHLVKVGCVHCRHFFVALVQCLGAHFDTDPTLTAAMEGPNGAGSMNELLAVDMPVLADRTP